MTDKLTAVVVACGLVATQLSACGAASPRFSGDPRHYLITLDQLPAPDFTVTSQPALRSGGAAATETFSRTVDFATSNGPIELVDETHRFDSDDSAHTTYTHDISSRDAQHGEFAMSTGSLGDEAHADSLVMTAPDGVQAVQVTLEWRVANIVVTLVARGRSGGTRLDDALVVAHVQTSADLGG